MDSSGTFELTSSFAHLVARVAPESLPAMTDGPQLAPHGTTIVAAAFTGGVVMAGDRRATMGNLIAQRDIEKVFTADEYSVIGIAGVAGIAIELVRLFQVELQHYEKVEGIPLSLDGKANRLGALVRGNLDKAMAGLAVVPMLTGWDIERRQGRIFSYDATGGRYEETGFHAIGSGAAFARGSLKKTHHRDLGEDDAIAAAIRSLYDAADDDSATGGPDLARNIFPVVMSASARGVRQLSSDQVADITTRVLETL
ncbi:proteasome subunit beta [Brooklawnia sp.]|uniref:proteasome subunit beta n=1 Tax=Brooklawnia sp. TaxID=2699740 RepID=UPI0031200408